MPNTSIQADGVAVPETRDISDAADILCRAISLNELMFRAGESLTDRALRDALTTGADTIDDLLMEVRSILYATMDAGVRK